MNIFYSLGSNFTASCTAAAVVPAEYILYFKGKIREDTKWRP